MARNKHPEPMVRYHVLLPQADIDACRKYFPGVDVANIVRTALRTTLNHYKAKANAVARPLASVNVDDLLTDTGEGSEADE